MSSFIFLPTILGSGNNPIGSAGGDLGGTYPNPTVDKANGATIPDSDSIPTGNVLQISGMDTLSYGPIHLDSGSNFVTGILPIGNQASQNLNGDVSGTTASATVNKINGSSVPIGGSLTVGNILQVSGSNSLSYGNLDLSNSNSVSGTLSVNNLPNATNSTKGILELAGDLGGSANSPGVLKINGATIPAAGSLINGQVLSVSGVSTLSYATLDLTNSNTFSGILPSGNLPNSSISALGIVKLSGDLGGTASTPSVLKINGTSVASSPLANQVLIASGSTVSSWSQISDANIASNAAISASKLAYTDNVSPTLSATNVQSAIDSIKTQAVSSAIQRLSQTITTANLQTAGAVLTATFNVGSLLPTNARVLGVEINVTQILAAVGLSVALVTVQSSTDLVGSLIASSTLLSTGLYGGTGTNQYLSRGGQQLTAIVTLTGALLSALTAGAFTVNVFYAVVQ